MRELLRRVLSRCLTNCPEPAGLEQLFTEPTPAEVAERRRELTAAYWWLREGPLAPVWYRQPQDDVIDMAEALVTLRQGVEAGRWKIETEGATTP